MANTINLWQPLVQFDAGLLLSMILASYIIRVVWLESLTRELAGPEIIKTICTQAMFIYWNKSTMAYPFLWWGACTGSHASSVQTLIISQMYMLLKPSIGQIFISNSLGDFCTLVRQVAMVWNYDWNSQVH